MFGDSPKTPKPGSPKRLATLISTLKYLGPRNELRPIAGGFAAKSGLLGAAVPKKALPPPGKIPFGRKKLLLELELGCPPKYTVGRIGPKNSPLGVRKPASSSGVNG